MQKNLPDSNNNLSDSNIGSIERILPTPLKPFASLARLDRPTGTWLLLWPCLWSLSLATDGMPDSRLCGIFALGAILMRSAGCTWNDIIDRNIDSQVSRTRERPIPSGRVTIRSAIIFLIILLATSLLILLQLNTFSICLGASSILLVITYPLMKRITYWPQIFLGLTFNWGALLGWTAYNESLSWPPILLYLGGIFWTLGYDTIYALQDKKDDAIIGVRSSALALGKNVRVWIAVFYSLTITCIAVSGFLTGINWPFWIGIMGCSFLFLWQVLTLRPDNNKNCLARFKASIFAGLIIFIGILSSNL